MAKSLFSFFLLFFLLFPTRAFAESGETKISILEKFGETRMMERLEHLDDMLFWGNLDPGGKTYEYWGYKGVTNMDGYGTPFKTIVFQQDQMVVFLLSCGPRLFRCEWQLVETLPNDLQEIHPLVISEKQLREDGWENDRAKAIFIWDTPRIYMEMLVSEYDVKNWKNSKIFGSVKTLPELVSRPEKKSEKDNKSGLHKKNID